MAKKKTSKTTSKKKTSKKKSPKGLKMDFISMSSLEGTTIDEKIEGILDTVKDGHLVVIDEALSSEDEARLVTATMEGIREDFAGIEFCSLPKKETGIFTSITRLIEVLTRQKFAKPGLTLIGPSTVISEIKRDPDAFYVSAKL